MSAKRTGLGKGLGALIGDLSQDYPLDPPKVEKKVDLEEDLKLKAPKPKKKAAPKASKPAVSAPKKPTPITKLTEKPSVVTPAVSSAPVTSMQPTTAGGSVVEMVSLSLIQRDPEQPRQVFHQGALEELSASIQAKGVIQPILAEKKHGVYVIIAGERRYRAAKMAGLTKVPVLVRNLSPEERYEIAIIENVQREDLNAMEEARAYKTLLDRTGMSQVELAQKIGKNRSTIANSIRLLQLSDDMQIILEQGRMSAGHARAILSVVNPADQRVLFKKIVQKGISVREAEAMAESLNKGARAGVKGGKVVKPQDPILADIEQRLLERLGTRVQLKGNSAKGKIEISYYSSDDLDRIYSLFLEEEEYHIQ